jgi:hypothetical protein
LSIESRQSSVITIHEKTLLENETVSLRLSVCDENGCAKALRAFSFTVAGRRRMGIRGEDAAKFNPKSKIQDY